METPFKDSTPGSDYFVNFMRRNGLSQKKPQAVQVARKKGVDPFAIANYFDMLKDIIQQIPPERIYNMDETSFSLDPSRVKVVGEKGEAAHRVTAGPGRENYSVLMGANAAGEKLPPLILFKAKNLWSSWLASKDKEYPGMSYTATQNGWMDTDTFTEYFCNTFLKSIPKERPVVLVYDGHTSHTSLALIEKAIEENVVILKLPPHTSHVLQPMDLSVFKPLKQEYDKAVIEWQRKHYGVKMPKSKFAEIISTVWSKCDTTIIQSGFRKAGIFPLCADVIPDKMYDPRALKRFKVSREPDNTSLTADASQTAPKVPTPKGYHRGPSQSGFTSISLPRDENVNPNIQSTAVVQKAFESNAEMMTREEKVSIAENSFELILLEHVTQCGSSQNVRKRKICSGAEVITSDEVVQRLKAKREKEEEKLVPKIKQEDQENAPQAKKKGKKGDATTLKPRTVKRAKLEEPPSISSGSSTKKRTKQIRLA